MNPTGGLQFAAGTGPGGTIFARSQRDIVYGDGTGLWTASFDIASTFVGQLPAAQNVGSFFRRKPLGGVGAVIALLLLLVAIFAPLIATDNPYKPEVERVFAQPGADAWLGGDDSSSQAAGDETRHAADAAL